jgi:hypothetical protein
LVRANVVVDVLELRKGGGQVDDSQGDVGALVMQLEGARIVLDSVVNVLIYCLGIADFFSCDVTQEAKAALSGQGP